MKKIQIKNQAVILCYITFAIIIIILRLLVASFVTTHDNFFDWSSVFSLYDILLNIFFVGLFFLYIAWGLHVYIDANGILCRNLLSPFQSKLEPLLWDQNIYWSLHAKMFFGFHFSIYVIQNANKHKLYVIPSIRLILNADDVLPMIIQYDNQMFCARPVPVSACPCPDSVHSRENEESEAETGLKSQEDGDNVEAKSE